MNSLLPAKLGPRETSPMPNPIYSKLEKNLRKARKKSERDTAQMDRLVQRSRYKDGAAQSPTPPPKISLEREEKILKILRSIESDIIISDSLSVKALSEKFLFEQSLIDWSKLSQPAWRNDDLERMMEPTSPLSLKERTAIHHRLLLRYDLEKAPVRVYGWDKISSMTKSVFFAWSMDLKTSRPFTLHLSKQVVASAKEARASFASHLQDRLRKLLNRRGLSSTEFWFVVELGGTGGFHLHGAIDWPYDKSQRLSIKKALSVLSGGGVDSALKISDAGPQGGWAAYCQKHRVISTKALGGSNLAASRSVQRRAKQMYVDFKAECARLLTL